MDLISAIKNQEKSFYNGLTFHRVLPGFMAQGGCPQGNGMGGPGYSIKAEFNSAFLGNPDLQPETVKTYELVWQQSFGNISQMVTGR